MIFQKIKKLIAVPLIILLFPTALFLFLINIQFSDLTFLQLHSIDDYAFHGSIRHMLSAFDTHKWSSLFGYGFYQYGFAYFFANALAAYPALLLGSTKWAIIIPRLITALFAIGSVALIYISARTALSKTNALLISTIVVTFPAFWYHATWFHPDWAMTFFITLSLFLLIKDGEKLGRYFWLSVFALGIAVMVKYQALMALPLLLTYIFFPLIHGKKLQNIFNRVTISFYSFTIILFVFLLGNPYILHPLGAKVFKSSLMGNLMSNATNHGNSLPSLTEKIQGAILDSYMTPMLFLLVILAALWSIYRYLKSKETSVVPTTIAVLFLSNLTYLLLFVEKTWSVYYLSAFVLGTLLLAYVLQQTSKLTCTSLLLLIIGSQVVFFGNKYYPLVTQTRDSGWDQNTYTQAENISINDFIQISLQSEHISVFDTILISAYTPFPYKELNTSYEQVRTIYGFPSKNILNVDDYIKSQQAFWGDTKTDEEIKRSFHTPTYIIIRKDLPYFPSNITESSDSEHQDAAALIVGLYSETLGFILLSENEFVALFKKINL